VSSLVRVLARGTAEAVKKFRHEQRRLVWGTSSMATKTFSSSFRKLLIHV
jgi:hypothetical protein